MSSSIDPIKWLIILLVIDDTLVSCNQPKICPNATWDPNGITFANKSTIGEKVRSFFIDFNNTIFVAAHNISQIVTWNEDSIDSKRNLTVNLFDYSSLFVTINGDIYFEKNGEQGRIYKWTMNSTITVPVKDFKVFCYGLFVDINNTLYCSARLEQKVIATSLNDNDNTLIIVAGTGSPGPSSSELDYPYGIFVNTNFDLYVADTGNRRIQLFRAGQMNGTTVAGNDIPQGLGLNHPTNVVLDADDYLFIADNGNNRIIRSGFGKFECVVGCTGRNGAASDELYRPYSIRFDSYGNVYVADEYNDRIQKFTITTNFCETPTTTFGSTVNYVTSDSSVVQNENQLTTMEQTTMTTTTMEQTTITTTTTVVSFELSYNQPKIGPNATWNPNGITIINSSIMGGNAGGFFINSNNSIFVAAGHINQILIWSEGSIEPERNLTTMLFVYTNLFVTIHGDIYFENGDEQGRIDKWPKNLTSSVRVMKLTQNCHGLFIDINDTLYCSFHIENRVVKISINDSTNTVFTIAGTGLRGSEAHLLAEPWGIFVNTNFDVYIADSGNNRIQLFRLGQRNGTTVAGNAIPNNLILYFPINIVVDGDGYLYIADNANHRIIRAGSNDYQCIAGCTGRNGPAPNELNKPYSIQFDSYGNLYVADEFNARIQKFTLATSSDCFPSFFKLIPNSPLQFRRNQDFYITSNIQFHCNESPLITTTWTILSCSSSCLNQIQLNQSIDTTSNELFIPARTLAYGSYELKLTVTIITLPALTSSSSVYIEIIQSNIITNLIQFDTSMLIHDYQENLILNPGKYSINLNPITFNSNDWYYTYYCRIYDLYNSTNRQELRLFDDQNQNCFSNKSNSWEYNDSINSSLTIFAKSLKLNKIYQFMIQIINRQNSSLQSIGYLIIQIENIQSPIIIINSISTISTSNSQLNYINSNTQLSLFSLCFGNCTTIMNITWNIYQGLINSSTNIIQSWIPFNQILSSWFFGLNSKNLTIIKDFFSNNKQIIYWRFEVIYYFQSKISNNTFDIELNQSPTNGSCLINPSIGTTMTLFTINCSNWIDKDNIKDFIFYGWRINPLNRIMLAYTTKTIFQLYLPASIDHTSSLYIIAQIRDTFDCITEFNLSSVIILPDFTAMDNFINTLQESNNDLDTIGQMINSISQVFNEMNDQSITMAFLNGIDINSISISSFDNKMLNIITNLTNNMTFNEQLNKHANIREYLIMFIDNLSIITTDDIKFQSSILSKLTQTINQLTRKASILASNKCLHLSYALQSIAKKISFEDIYLISMHIIECSTNVYTGINAPLQERVNILNSDLIQTKKDINQNEINDDLFIKNQNLYYQKEKANEIANQTKEINLLITSIFNIHLNLNQNIIINTSNIFFSLEKILLNRFNDIQIHLNNNSIILLRTMIERLAPADNRYLSYTNLSRSFSLSILDENCNDININTNKKNSIEFFIPRDANIIIPSMYLQNITLINKKNLLFNLHFINLTKTNRNITYSIHFEMYPLNFNLSYLLIYKFNNKPKINFMDGWKLFCSSNLNNNEIYTHFISNNQTLNHQSIIYGIRQLNLNEINDYCLLNKTLFIINESVQFSSNYKIRIYQSACFYLDSNNNWQSNGLLVGPLTNHYQTQCFSTHLTTFACAFQFLPAPINWNSFKNDQFRSLFLNYTCECLDDSYSGRYCEITDRKIVVRQMISKSFAYVVIIAMIALMMFIIILDGLKYFFGIDPVGEELKKRLQQKKQAKKVKPPIILRFIYVNQYIANKCV